MGIRFYFLFFIFIVQHHIHAVNVNQFPILHDYLSQKWSKYITNFQSLLCGKYFNMIMWECKGLHDVLHYDLRKLLEQAYGTFFYFFVLKLSKMQNKKLDQALQNGSGRG